MNVPGRNYNNDNFLGIQCSDTTLLTDLAIHSYGTIGCDGGKGKSDVTVKVKVVGDDGNPTPSPPTKHAIEEEERYEEAYHGARSKRRRK